MAPLNSDPVARPIPDHVIIRALWPVLLAAVIGLFPFTVYSTFLVQIALTADEDPAIVGALRGLGGVAALIAGIAVAPLVARWAAPRATAASLMLLAVACGIATWGTLPALIVFCLGIGAATAVLTPTLLRIATMTFTGRGDSGRAATIVTATQSLAAVLAAPVIGAIALWQGWRGALGISAGMALVIAVLFVASPTKPGFLETAPLRYGESFARLRRRRDLLAVIGIAFLRTTAFMGQVALLAAHYHDRFALGPVAFTLVWTVSGASFFCGNFLAGRWARSTEPTRRWLLYAALLGAAVAVVLVFTAHWIALALAATAVLAFCHAIVAALVTTLIADRGGDLVAPAYSINAAAMSLGVFVGALIAGAGLALGGSLGVALSLLAPTLLAIALVPVATAERQY